MQYANPDQTWAEWLADNCDTATGDHALAVLREYIAETARNYRGHEPGLTADWMNKKLWTLGVPERIQQENIYSLAVPVTATLGFNVYGCSRKEALEKFIDRLRAVESSAGASSVHVAELRATGDPQFTAGPEDTDSGDVSPDAPTTVQDTLVKLRETIMLAHIAGPKICKDGANQVLRDYGLAELPELKKFVVTRPVEAVASTEVMAWDEASAMRVAGWRWEDDKSGYTVGEMSATDAPQLVADSAS